MTEGPDIYVKPCQPEGVERAVISSEPRKPRRAARGLLWLLVIAAGGMTNLARGAGAVVDLPPPMFAETSGPAKKAAPAAKPKKPYDELVYHDGDHVHGRFIKRDGDTLVFQSDRFGLLRVPAADADLVLAKPSPAAIAAAPANEKPDVERAPFSPLALARGLKDFFGSWHGKFALAAEMMQDGSKNDSGTVEAHLQRKWTRDEVQLNSRYDYSSVNDTTSTDMIKADGMWRHDLPHQLFGIYRPTLEWNRSFFRDGVPADYVLLQQEIGAGVNVFSSDTRQVRAGLSENVFDTWVLPTNTRLSQNVESVFVEVEAKLPWRIVVSDRGVYYYSFVKQTEGWENRFEINKKLTETLTIGVRHEIRHNNPDVRSADYRRLRVLFGFDF